MSFTKIHLKLDKADFKPSPPLPIEEVPTDYERFLQLMQRVGAPSKWEKRQVFHDPESVARLKQLFRSNVSHLWLFKDREQETGFCQVAPVQDLAGLFNEASGIAEIYKVGLFPEYVGQGLGKGYLSSVLTELFKENNIVYLSTRDTNMVNPLHFYKKLGFQVMHAEVLPDDYVDP